MRSDVKDFSLVCDLNVFMFLNRFGLGEKNVFVYISMNKVALQYLILVYIS